MSDPIKVHGEQILSVIPTALGFHPSDSVVVVALLDQGNGRSLVGPIARVDIGTDLRPVGEALRRHASRAIVVVYSDDEFAAWGVDTDALGMDILNRISAGNAPVDQHPALAAENALAGRRTLTDRAELAASVAYRPGADTHDPLLIALTTADARDRFLAEHLDDARATVPTLVAALAATPDSHPAAANLATTTAALAYVSGDGGLANVALDRALAADPGHRLAHLLGQGIGAGLSPAQIARGLRG